MTIRNPFRRIAMGVLFLATLCNVFLMAKKVKAVAGSPAHQQVNADVSPARVTESPLACNVKALEATQRQRVQALVKQLRASQQGVKELSNGYAIRLPQAASIIQDAAEYISLEHLC